ncbi:MAG: hypothetical protein M3Z66_08595, partial [Chloroflexota bacterium]|nr:hypothetical protein [Chloroflexota bacterium]
PISANPRQPTILLEHLARLSFSGRFSAQDILLEEGRRMGASRTVIFVTATLTPEIIAILTSRQFKGRVAVVYCGRHAAPLVRDLPVFLVAPPAEERRVS